MNNVTCTRGLWKSRVKIPSSFFTEISCKDEQAQFNEKISILRFFFIIASIIFIKNN